MARTGNPAPSAVGSAPDPAHAAVAPPAGNRPAAAVLAALTAGSGGATVAVIAGHAHISVAAARQALIAHEKAGAATRVKGRRPGLPDTWKRTAGPAAPPSEAPRVQTPGRDSPGGGAEPAASGVADADQPAHAPARGKAEVGTGPARPSSPRPPGASWRSPRPPTRPAAPWRPGTGKQP